MKTIKTSEYDITIGDGAAVILSDVINDLRPDSVLFVADKNVLSLYPDVTSIDAECPVFTYALCADEAHKTIVEVSNVLDFAAHSGLTRSSLIIALGGGVTGDLAGFSASVYMRGINYIQMPTTLLACADSSVGGKTGVNSAYGKNLIGAFHSPSAVIADTSFLPTLPEKERLSGMGELIKSSVIGGFDDIFTSLPIEDAILRSVSLKSEIVDSDPFESGKRRILNFGHTIGHAIEYFENTHGDGITHGAAVAVGMSLAAKISSALGHIGHERRDRILSLIKNSGLPTETDVSVDEIADYIVRDKKISSGQINFIMPAENGGVFEEKLPLQALLSLVSEVM